MAYTAPEPELVDLIRTILPHGSTRGRVVEIHNSMALLSTTSSHWALKLLIYAASNKLLKPGDLDHIWRLVEETGIKKLSNFSNTLILGETSLKAALECLFEAGVWAHRVDIVSWLLDVGIHSDTMIRSQDMDGPHLPLVVTLLSLESWRSTTANAMARLLMSKGASTLRSCCEKHNTATHLAIMNGEVDAENLEMFLQAVEKTKSHQMSPPHLKSVSQEHRTNGDNDEAQRSRDTVLHTLQSLVDMFRGLLETTSLPSVTPEMRIRAVESNNHRLLRVLHRLGFSMDCCDSSQRSPLVRGLELLADGVNIDTIKLLLVLDAKPNYASYSDNADLCSRALQTAIHHCFPGDQAQIVEDLIRKDAKVQGSVSCGNDSHQNLMHCALIADAESRPWIDQDVPMLLHKAGLPFPETCLMDCMESAYAVSMVCPLWDEEPIQLLSALISETKDLSPHSSIGWTALDYALVLGMKEAEELMSKKGAVHSRKFLHDHCLSGYYELGELEASFSRVSTPNDDGQNEISPFYRIIGTFRAQDYAGDELTSRVCDLVHDYRELPRNRTHEAYIIREACVAKNASLIDLTLEMFQDTYSPAALEKLIWSQAEEGADNWKFIEKLLQRGFKAPLTLQRLQEDRIFLFAVFISCKGNTTILEWFYRNHEDAFENANLYPSAFLMKVFHISLCTVPRYRLSCDRSGREGLRYLNISHLSKFGRKTSTYLGLLAVCTGRVDQMNELLKHGMQPNRRFAWSLTMLQIAVARADLPMTRRLLKAGADKDGRAPWRDIPESIYSKISNEVRRQLTIIVSERKTKRRNAVQLAVEQGDFSMLRLLLGEGADLNGPPARVGGATALQISCIKGYIDITRFLIEKKADVNALGAKYFGRTALEGAAEHGRLDTVLLLLKSGCRVDKRFRSQYIRAVGFARAQAHHTVVKELEDRGGWTKDDEDDLSRTDLRDIEPKYRELRSESKDDDDVSEVDSDDLNWEGPDTFPFEMDKESESEDYTLAMDEEDATSSRHSTPQEILDECGSYERGSESQDVRLDTWDDILKYYGEDKGLEFL